MNRRDLERHLRDHGCSQIDEGASGELAGLVRTTNVTFAEAAAEWLRYVEHERAVKPGTLAGARYECRARAVSETLKLSGAEPSIVSARSSRRRLLSIQAAPRVCHATPQATWCGESGWPPEQPAPLTGGAESGGSRSPADRPYPSRIIRACVARVLALEGRCVLPRRRREPGR